MISIMFLAFNTHQLNAKSGYVWVNLSLKYFSNDARMEHLKGSLSLHSGKQTWNAEYQAWSKVETANGSGMRRLHSSTTCPVFNGLVT